MIFTINLMKLITETLLEVFHQKTSKKIRCLVCFYLTLAKTRNQL